MLNVPDPSLLQTFVIIVDTGSFTAAAKRIHRTQSAVSMQIKRLESALGHPLFERNSRDLRLSGMGEVFYDYARRILDEYKLAMEAVGHGFIEGDLTVGAPDDFATTFLPKVLAGFRKLYPRVRIHIVSEPSRQLINSLSVGSVDIALLTEGEGSTSPTVVHREPLVWVSSEHHQVHTQDPIPLAVFHSGDVFRRSAVGELRGRGRDVSVVVTSSGFAGLDSAVQAGIAVAVIFEGSVRPGMRILTPQEGFPTLPSIGVVVQRSDKQRHELADLFVDHVTEVLGCRESSKAIKAWLPD